MELKDKIIFFAGSGNMAQSIIAGIISSGSADAKNIICNDLSQEKLDFLKEKYGVQTCLDKKNCIPNADIIFLAVKPQNIDQAISEIKPYIKNKVLVISIVAAITSKYIEEAFGGQTAVVRVMPNTPALVGCAAAALCAGSFASEADLTAAKMIFQSLGLALIMSEDKFDAVTALSGSGPAYVFYLCELMQQAGEKLGLDKSAARDLAVKTVLGAGRMLAETGTDAAVLRKNVTSPNGTTQAALEYFQSQNFSDTVFKAMEKAALRSKELSK